MVVQKHQPKCLGIKLDIIAAKLDAEILLGKRDNVLGRRIDMRVRHQAAATLIQGHDWRSNGDRGGVDDNGAGGKAVDFLSLDNNLVLPNERVKTVIAEMEPDSHLPVIKVQQVPGERRNGDQPERKGYYDEPLQAQEYCRRDRTIE